MLGNSAYERFQKSLIIGYEQWHDGVGYDLAAFGEMTAEEREGAVRSLMGRELGWREVEVFEAAGTAEGRKGLIASAKAKDPDTRLAALEALHRLGKLPDFADFLAKELGEVAIGTGMTRALLLVPEFDCGVVREGLLWGVRNRPEVAVHYAGMLAFLAGKAKSEFDWDMRPLFLKFGKGVSEGEKEAAWGELCGIVGVDAETAGRRRPRVFGEG